MPDVSIIVVSYNTRELTRRCLTTLCAGESGVELEVILVDNASADGSAEMVRRDFPHVRLIANPDNRGFAAANNQAFAFATGRNLLLLNPDTELRPEALRKVLAFAQAHPEVGAIGCRVVYPDGTPQSTIFRLPRLTHLAINLLVPNRLVRRSRILGRARYIGVDLDQTQEVEVIAGCFMFIPREVLARVGGMDESFFMYGEEADWCRRIRAAGWRVVYYPDATIVHHGGQSARQRPDPMTRAMAKSQLLLMHKTRGPFAAYAANLLMLFRDLPRVALWRLLGLAPRLRDSRLRQSLHPAAARINVHLRGLIRPDWNARG